MSGGHVDAARGRRANDHHEPPFAHEEMVCTTQARITHVISSS